MKGNSLYLDDFYSILTIKTMSKNASRKYLLNLINV